MNLYTEANEHIFLENFKTMYKAIKSTKSLSYKMDRVNELMLYLYKNRKHIPKIPNLINMVSKLVTNLIDLDELPNSIDHMSYDQFVLDVYELFVLIVDKINKKYGIDYSKLIPEIETVWHED